MTRHNAASMSGNGGLRLVGHKGASLIAPGNTQASFAAAVEANIDTIEIDVLWTRDGHPKAPAAERTPLGHRPRLARRRTTAAADADRGARPLPRAAPRPGRDRSRHQAPRPRGGDRRGGQGARPARPGDALDDGALDPCPCPRARALCFRRGWTYPKVTKDWASKRWARLPMLGSAGGNAAPLPGIAARELPKMGVGAIWIYHPIASPAPRRGRPLRRSRADRLDRRRPRPDAEAGRDRGHRDLLERPAAVRLDQLIVRAPTSRRPGRPPSDRRACRRPTSLALAVVGEDVGVLPTLSPSSVDRGQDHDLVAVGDEVVRLGAEVLA